MTRLRTTWLASAVLGFTFGGTAVAQSPRSPSPNAEDQHQQEQDEKNNQDSTNQAGPVEDGRGIDSMGNVIDGTGDDRNNPSDATAPTHESVDTDIDTSRTTNPPDVYVTPTTIVTTDQGEGQDFYGRYGISIAAGGGTSGFTNEQLRDATDVGGNWLVRLSVGTRSPLAFEGAYIGSAQSIEALGIDTDALLVGNGVQAGVRLNTTIDLPVQPFVFAAAAWRRYDLATDTNTSDLDDIDNVYEFPVGLGIAGKFQGLMLDLRGEFRPTIDNNLLPELASDGEPLEDVGNDNFAAMHRWGVNASIGYEF